MKVLVAVDSSQFSEEILEWVGTRPWPEGSEILLLTVVEQSHAWDTELEYVHQCKVIQEHRVGTLKKRLPKLKIVSEVVSGSAKDLIVENAQEWGANLIIVGSHGDTGIRRDKVGSVAAAVVNRAPCSVNVFKVGQSRNREAVSSGASNKSNKKGR